MIPPYPSYLRMDNLSRSDGKGSSDRVGQLVVSIDQGLLELGYSRSSGLGLFSLDQRTFQRVRRGDYKPSARYLERLRKVSSFICESKALLRRYSGELLKKKISLKLASILLE